MWYCDIVIVSHCHILSLSLCHWITLSHLDYQIVMVTLVSLRHFQTDSMWYYHITKIIQHPDSVIQSNNQSMHHSVRVSHSQKIILEHCYRVTICQLLKLSCVIQSNIHIATVAQLHIHTIILSYSLSVQILHYVTVKLSNCNISTM